jgi:DNA-binding beta-propeller fold protein YncE
MRIWVEIMEPSMKNTSERNFATGHKGLVAVDKIGNCILFLDPQTFKIEKVLDGFAPNVHDLLVSQDLTRAYVPIYGDGIHGKNPRPGHLIAVIDLEKKEHIADFSVSPYRAPHGMRWGRNGQLYCICEDSGVVLELDPVTGKHEGVLHVGSDKGHRIEITADGSKLYAETEEDGFVAILDLATRKKFRDLRLPSQLDGLGISPDGMTVIAVDGEKPNLYVIDSTEDRLVSTIALEHHKEAAQIVRYSPDGRFVVVTSHEEPRGTILSSDLQSQAKIPLEKGPMDLAFHPDGRTVLIANQGAGSISVVSLETAQVLSTFDAGKGVETLSFF